MNEKKKIKSTCLFCGEEFEYDWDGIWSWQNPPKRKFCGDSTWSASSSTDYTNRCRKGKMPDDYKSYIWLCKIYCKQIGYNEDTEIKPYIGDTWLEHHQILRAQYSKDCDEYYS